MQDLILRDYIKEIESIDANNEINPKVLLLVNGQAVTGTIIKCETFLGCRVEDFKLYYEDINNEVDHQNYIHLKEVKIIPHINLNGIMRIKLDEIDAFSLI